MRCKGFASFLLVAAIHLLPASVMAASAVAVDQAAHKFGYCHSKPTLEEAKQCAVSTCSKSGAKNCQIAATGTKGGYSAIAAGSGQLGIVLSSNEDAEMVSARAMWDCQQKATGCDYFEVQTGQCKIKTSCKIVAKWKESEEGGQSESSGTRQQQSQQTPSNAAQGTAGSKAAREANILVDQGNEKAKALLKAGAPQAANKNQQASSQGNSSIEAEAKRRGEAIDPNGQGLNQAQIDAMEMQRRLMWNSTGGGTVYR